MPSLKQLPSIRSWSDFFDLREFKLPRKNQVADRIIDNVSYWRTNYGVVLALFLVLQMFVPWLDVRSSNDTDLTERDRFLNPLFLLGGLFIVLIWAGVVYLQQQSLSIGGFTLKPTQLRYIAAGRKSIFSHGTCFPR
jgi:hypothetical protein